MKINKIKINQEQRRPAGGVSLADSPTDCGFSWQFIGGSRWGWKGRADSSTGARLPPLMSGPITNADNKNIVANFIDADTSPMSRSRPWPCFGADGAGVIRRCP